VPPSNLLNESFQRSWISLRLVEQQRRMKKAKLRLIEIQTEHAHPRFVRYQRPIGEGRQRICVVEPRRREPDETGVPEEIVLHPRHDVHDPLSNRFVRTTFRADQRQRAVSRLIWPGRLAFLLASALSASSSLAATPVYRIDHVSDGDTVALRNGQRVRLVQIDTPEVFFGRECYGRLASWRTKTLLPRGTRVRLLPEPVTDRVDQYGRLLRYVVRVRDGVNVNIRLVAVGAAAPYFYQRRRGRFAKRLNALALRAKAKKLGLWRACPRTRYNPYKAIATRR
jgi:endonuclease YncB( thermonuclease family)